ncbi:MAG: GDP-mannose 4,6-dehydratase [Pseudomonadota bacterium]
MNNKKALIIGISGQDGSYLAQLLLKKGYDVIGTSRDALASSFSNLINLGIKDKIQLESMSLNEFRSVLQVLSDIQPDEVYNLAGQSSVGLSFDQPVETFDSISIAVLNLLEAIRFLKLPIRLYNASSSECFGNTQGESASEKTLFQPRSPYAVAKAAAYWQVSNYREAYNIYACSGLLFNHESPLRPARFVTKKIVSTACRIAKGSNEKLILGNTSIQRDWGWAPEYVSAMWMMLQLKQAEDFVIATGKTYALSDFVSEVFLQLNLNYKDYVETNNSFFRPTDIEISVANPSKAKMILGWESSYTMPDIVKMMVEAELAREH